MIIHFTSHTQLIVRTNGQQVQLSQNRCHICSQALGLEGMKLEHEALGSHSLC